MKTGVRIELETDDVDGFAYRRLAIILKRLGRDHGWRCRDIRAMVDAPATGHQHTATAMQGLGLNIDTTGAPDAPELQPRRSSTGRVADASEGGRYLGLVSAGYARPLASSTGSLNQTIHHETKGGRAACATPDASNKAFGPERRIKS